MMIKNKKILIPFCIVICILLVVGILVLIINNSNNLEKINDIQSKKQFRAKIIEVYSDGNFMVEPNENEQIRNSSDKISISGDPNIEWKVGMEVVITYNGEIMLSYPARVIATDIQIYSQEDVSNNEEFPVFFGRVIESNSNYIIVEPNENEEERKSSDKFSISLGKYNDALYEVGTNVKITYTGTIKESYPAQIEVINIEIKSTDNFELIFEERKDLGIKYIINEGETDKYSYNIKSYGGDVYIVIDENKMSLNEALLNNKITMDEIITTANRDLDNEIIQGGFYDDGGTAIYKYETYTILKYHTLDGNRDVYIGIPQMGIGIKDI